ncbi:MAG: DUF6265 family protein [Pseudomonadota bacterium]
MGPYPIRLLVTLLCVSFCSIAAAQSKRTENTFKLDEPDFRPPASLEDVSWLAGAWAGEAFGDRFEEVWNPPSGDSMVGFFKLLKGDDVAFYELLLLVEEEGSLVMKVKHFHKDFSAWEEKDDYLSFRLVGIEPDAVHFSGLSFYRRSDDYAEGFIAMRSNDEVREEKMTFHRQR